MLIVDQDAKRRDDRTFGFWSDRGSLRSSHLERLGAAGFCPGFSRTARLKLYRCRTIRELAYRLARQGCRLPACGFAVHITHLQDSEGEAKLVVDGQEFFWEMGWRPIRPADLGAAASTITA
jgi:hypothetical protein